jgi:hypothetical protein
MYKYVWVALPLKQWEEENPGQDFNLFPYSILDEGIHILVKKPIEEVIKERMPTKEDLEEFQRGGNEEFCEGCEMVFNYWRDKLLKQD